MPLGLIQNKGLNVIHTVFLFSRRRSLNRALRKPLQHGAVHLAIYMMIYFSEQAGYTLG